MTEEALRQGGRQLAHQFPRGSEFAACDAGDGPRPFEGSLVRECAQKTDVKTPLSGHPMLNILQTLDRRQYNQAAPFFQADILGGEELRPFRTLALVDDRHQAVAARHLAEKAA